MGEGEMSEELKPCPFCGGEAHLFDGNWVECTKCGCQTPETFEEVAISAWNRRAALPAAVPEGGIVDTPLDWTDRSDGSSFAITPFGTYRVDPPDFDAGVTSYRWSYCFDEYYDEGEYSCDNRDQGKALAQVHWDERVSSIFRVRNVTAAPPPPTEGDGWRPIETAPRDGAQIILLSANGTRQIGWWSEAASAWAYGGGSWGENITHWQPLPAAPTEASDE